MTLLADFLCIQVDPTCGCIKR